MTRADRVPVPDRADGTKTDERKPETTQVGDTCLKPTAAALFMTAAATGLRDWTEAL